MNTPEDPNQSVTLNELSDENLASDQNGGLPTPDNAEAHSAAELEAVFDVPVKVQAILGKATMEVSQLLKLAPGAVVELDRRVGEAIDIYVNNRLVARGEVVMVEEHIGVTMTEIVKADRL